MPNLRKCSNDINNKKNNCNCKINSQTTQNFCKKSCNKNKKLNFKCCTKNICSSLNEVECFLNNSKNLLKSFRLYKILKK